VLVLVSLVIIAISVAASFFSEILGFVSPFLTLIVSYGLQIFLITPITYGAVLVATRMARGETSVSRVSVGNMFEPLQSRYWPSVGAAAVIFVLSLAMLVASLLCGGLIGGAIWLATGMPNSGTSLDIARGIGVGVAIITYVITLIPLMCLLLMPVLVVDDRSGRMSIGRALTTAWNLTRGRRLSMLALVVVAGIMAALTVLLLCVGIVLVGYPYLLAIIGSAAAMLIRPLEDPNRCPTCGYNRASLPRCPECGTDNPAASAAARMNPFGPTGPDIPLRPYT
jgi:hypothetical protein